MDENNCAKNDLDGFVAAIDMYSRPAFSFALLSQEHWILGKQDVHFH